MKRLTTTTLKIGSNLPNVSPLSNSRGFTFIEVMVTIIILSVGIVAIFKSFLISIDQFNLINHRMYANLAIENRIAKIERMLIAYRALPFDPQWKETVELGENKTIVFEQRMTISEIERFNDVFRLDLELTWPQNNHTSKILRSTYISDFR